MSSWDRTPERRRATAWPAAATAAVAAADEGGGLEPGTLYRGVSGVDRGPVPMPAGQFAGGRYIRRNKWNDSTTQGAMHLIQQSNTLGAEIELAAAATIRRVIGGRELTGAQELIACAKYGVPDRNSDPHIGEVVNSIARQKADITLSDPVGIYFDDLATDGWSTPDGSDPKSFWTVERGDTGFPVRAVYEVPAGRGFAVGDITIGGRPIEFGAQIADFVTVRLTATACRLGLSTARPQTACVELAAGDDVTPGAFAPGAFSAHGYLGTHPDQASRSTRLVA